VTWAEAELLGGALGVEGDVQPAEPRTWDYPGFPAYADAWTVSWLDLEAMEAATGQEFATDEDARAWALAHLEEEAQEALVRALEEAD